MKIDRLFKTTYVKTSHYKWFKRGINPNSTYYTYIICIFNIYFSFWNFKSTYILFFTINNFKRRYLL